MNKRESMSIARQARKPKLVYDSTRYSIEEIKLNYQIHIKLPMKSPRQTYGRDFYTSPIHGIDYAHEVAEEEINKYFVDHILTKAKVKA